MTRASGGQGAGVRAHVESRRRQRRAPLPKGLWIAVDEVGTHWLGWEKGDRVPLMWWKGCLAAVPRTDRREAKEAVRRPERSPLTIFGGRNWSDAKWVLRYIPSRLDVEYKRK